MAMYTLWFMLLWYCVGAVLTGIPVNIAANVMSLPTYDKKTLGAELNREWTLEMHMAHLGEGKFMVCYGVWSLKSTCTDRFG